MSYNLQKISQTFAEACYKAGIKLNHAIKLNGRLTKTLGRVIIAKDSSGSWYPTIIEFSKQFIETATDECIKEVIYHEAAHYIVTTRTGKDCGHNAEFKAVCEEIGIPNCSSTTTRVERIVEQTAIYKYTVTCNTYNKIIGGYSRMCNTLQHINECYCKKCKQYNLSYTKNW